MASVETFSTRVFTLTANRKQQFQVRRLAFMASTALATPPLEVAAILNLRTAVVLFFIQQHKDPCSLFCVSLHLNINIKTCYIQI